MGLQKRRDSKYYWYSFRINGLRHQGSTKATNKKLAERVLAEKINEAYNGPTVATAPATGKTFGELAKEYRELTRTQKAFRSKDVHIKVFSERFGHMPLCSFRTQDVELFQREYLSGRKPSTVNRHLATLKHMFAKAVDWEWTDKEILEKVRRVKLMKEHNKRVKYLTAEQSRELIEASCPHLKPLVIAALHTGMRRGELLSLEWDKHVDLENNLIHIEDTKNGERRDVSINSVLHETLVELKGRRNSRFVFTDSNGRGLKSIKKSFDTARKKAGLVDFRFHDLRHTFASHMAMLGDDLFSLKERLGHKSITMTLRYSHMMPGQSQKMLEKLSERLK